MAGPRIYGCLLLFCMGSLQHAVEEGARCASVKAATCPESVSIINYAKAAYHGPIAFPTFAYATLTCGRSVSGSGAARGSLYADRAKAAPGAISPAATICAKEGNFPCLGLMATSNLFSQACIAC